MIDDIEDDYHEYLDDELGYAWDAWDVLPADAIRRHDELVDATAEQLRGIDPAAIDDIERWAYARAARRIGDIDGALEAIRLVLASTDEHRGLSYDDVFVAAIETMAANDASDEAALHLGTFRTRWPDDTRAARLTVYIAARSGDLDAAVGAARSELREDPDRLFEIAEDLVSLGYHEHAARVLTEVADLASKAGLRALSTEVAVLRESLATTGE